MVSNRPSSVQVHMKLTFNHLGYVIFNPAFQEREVEKMRKQRYSKVFIIETPPIDCV
jgi:hypothetical protein